MAQNLNVLIKTHKEYKHMRPVMNNIKELYRKFAKYLNKSPNQLTKLPYKYATRNSEVAQGLNNIQIIN
jgi:hypothetical protein